MVDVSQYKVGLVLSVEDGGRTKSGKALKVCKVNVGDESKPVTIVTSATVRDGDRIVVALAGTTYLNDEGEDAPVTKASVGGVMSDGMLCDSRMLGWSGGAAGVAARVPDNFDIGSAPPASNRPGQEAPKEPLPEVKGLFEKKLTKEEKKKLAEERRKAKKAAKEAKKAAESS